MNAIDIYGWMSKRELNWLVQQAKNCDLIIEIGTWFGRSTYAMGQVVKGRVITIDHFSPDTIPGFSQKRFYRKLNCVSRRDRRKPDWLYKKCIENLAELIYRGKVEVIKGESEIVVCDLREFSGKVDMVFIDGDHSYIGVRKDIENYKPLVRSGGLLCGHDYGSWVKKAVNEILPEARRIGGTTIWACRC